MSPTRDTVSPVRNRPCRRRAGLERRGGCSAKSPPVLVGRNMEGGVAGTHKAKGNARESTFESNKDAQEILVQFALSQSIAAGLMCHAQ